MNKFNEKFDNLIILDYEMFNHNDPFGKMMVQNFEVIFILICFYQSIGCPLVGIFDYPTLNDQSQRFKDLGFTQVYIKDMLKVYNEYLDKDEVKRI